MKKTLFLISHVESGSDLLANALDQNPRVQFCKTDLIYNHPDILETLTSKPHKCTNIAAIWMDELLYNQRFSCKHFYNVCKFIYVIRDIKYFDNECQFRYYCYRLRRIYEMAKNTPGAVLVTYDDLISGRCHSFIEKYLYLKEPLGKINPKDIQAKKKFEQTAYERYFKKLSIG